MESEATREFVARGDQARDVRDWNEARLNYERALDLDPGMAHIWIQLGHSAKEGGDRVGAEQAYRNALKLNPADADGHLQFGHLMKITERYSAAFAFYRHALALDPHLSDARKELEFLLRKRNRDLHGSRTGLGIDEPGVETSPGVARCSPFQGPDFLCIGMAKAGTGWLFDQLKYHPDFWMPPIKEFAYLKRDVQTLKVGAHKRLRELKDGNTHRLFSWSNRHPGDLRDIAFLEEAAWSIGNPLDIVSYAALFRHKQTALSGDITPGYSSLDGAVIAQFASLQPSTKLILLVRDPVDRAWSRLCMWARLGTFDASIAENSAAFADFLSTDEKLKRESFPSAVMQRWRTHATSLELRPFFFDDLVLQPERLRHDILLYLGADPDKKGGEQQVGFNKKAKKRPNIEMRDTIRSILIEYFRDELFACADLFGGAAKMWPSRHGL